MKGILKIFIIYIYKYILFKNTAISGNIINMINSLW